MEVETNTETDTCQPAVHPVILSDKESDLDNDTSAELIERNKNEQSGDTVYTLEYCQQYLRKLWDEKTVDYFFEPVFRDAPRKVFRSASTASHFVFGGYPTGLLEGAAVSFRPDLNPWLFKSLQRCAEEAMIARGRSRSRGSLTPNLTRRRSSSGPEILDLLRSAVGQEATARDVWNFLRGNSKKILENIENKASLELKRVRETFAREYLDGMQEECLSQKDVTMRNNSPKTKATSKKLNITAAERQFRQIRSMAQWAQRNRDFFQTMSYQYGLRDIARQCSNSCDNAETADDDGFVSQQKARQLLPLLASDDQRQEILRPKRPTLKEILPPNLPKIRDTLRKPTEYGPLTERIHLSNIILLTPKNSTQTGRHSTDRTVKSQKSNEYVKGAHRNIAKYTEDDSNDIYPLNLQQLCQSESNPVSLKNVRNVTESLSATWCPNDAVPSSVN